MKISALKKLGLLFGLLPFVLPGTLETFFFTSLYGTELAILPLIGFITILSTMSINYNNYNLKNALYIIIIIFSLIGVLNSVINYKILNIFEPLQVIIIQFIFIYIISLTTQFCLSEFLRSSMKFIVYVNFIYILLFGIIITNFVPFLMEFKPSYASMHVASFGFVTRIQSLIGAANTSGTLIALIAVVIYSVEKSQGQVDKIFQVVCALAILLTLSRVGLILFVIVHVSYWIMQFSVKVKRSDIGIVILLFLAVVPLAGPVFDRLFSEGLTSTSVRMVKLERALQAFSNAKPFLYGSGPGTMESRNPAIWFSKASFNDLTYPKYDYVVRESENFFIIYATEVGLIVVLSSILLIISNLKHRVLHPSHVWLFGFFLYIMSESSFKHPTYMFLVSAIFLVSNTKLRKGIQ